MSSGLPTVNEGEWKKVRRAFQRIDSILLGPDAEPEFTGLTLSGLTAPTLSTGAGDVDIISFYYDGTDFHGQGALDFS